MMRCLCCGKELIRQNDINIGWHTKCVKRFFGVTVLPHIDISNNAVEELVSRSIGKRNTVAGVQKKMSLHLEVQDMPRLTIMDYPTGFIMKPQTKEYKHMPEYEHLSMLMAEAVGIKTAEHALIQTGSDFSYITKRIDRSFENDMVKKYAMEDFCQISERLTLDKYKGSYEQCGKVIRTYSSHSGLDIAEFFIRVVFSFFIGNSDMHLKNFSLIEIEPGSRLYELSAAYDMLPVNLILPEDTEQTALMLNGKRKNIRRKDFLRFAENIGVETKTASRMIDDLISKMNKCLKLCDESFLDEDEKESFKDLVKERISIIS